MRRSENGKDSEAAPGELGTVRAFLHAVAASADLCVLGVDPGGLIVLAEGRCGDIRPGIMLTDLVAESNSPRLQSALDNAFSSGVLPGLEIEFYDVAGRPEPVELHGQLVPDSEKPILLIVRKSVSTQPLPQSDLQKEALHDRLTGLPSRSLFADRVTRAIERARRRKAYHFALLHLDVDRFKMVNEVYGHEAGDSLLRDIAGRLKETVRELDTVCRIAGDEFVILLEEMDSPRVAVKVVKRLRRELKRPFPVKGAELQLSCSIGIVLSPAEDVTADEVLHNAAIAMHRAKEVGQDKFKVFNQRMRTRAVQLAALERDMAASLASGGFSLAFQPIVDLRDDLRPWGFEVLCRWEHPTRGMVPPSEFIPVAEQSGIIIDLGLWVLHKACTTMAAWREKFPVAVPLVLSVNVSGKQFAQPGLTSRISRILEYTGLPADRLKLEITETALMENAAEAASRLQTLRELGITLSMDDFGTGYSSMSYLQQFPLDNLKIDLSFIRMLDVARENVEIVKAIINLAHTLGMEVVAEGVEKTSHQDILSELNCEFCQGFLYSKPLSESQTELYLQELEQIVAEREREAS